MSRRKWTVPEQQQAEDSLYWQIMHASYLGKYVWERQYRFAAAELGRDWRLDLAMPSQKLGIEVQGGIWIRGAHGHPVDILRNMEKHNALAFLRWTFLQFTPKHVKDGSALRYIEGLFIRYFTGKGSLELCGTETSCTPSTCAAPRPGANSPRPNMSSTAAKSTPEDSARRVRQGLLAKSMGRSKSRSAWDAYQPAPGASVPQK